MGSQELPGGLSANAAPASSTPAESSGAEAQSDPATSSVARVNLLIFGCREWKDYRSVLIAADTFLACLDPGTWLSVVSGCARGADQLGERWANSRGLEIVRFPADWDRHGNSAGPIRNQMMADYLSPDHDYAFGFGSGRGTSDMAAKLVLRGVAFEFMVR